MARDVYVAIVPSENDETLARSFKNFLEIRDEKDTNSPIFWVRIVAPGEAVMALAASGNVGDRKTLIFLSNVFSKYARDIAAEHPEIRVVLVTGADAPKGEVVNFYKRLFSPDNLKDIVRG